MSSDDKKRKKFYNLTLDERLRRLIELTDLTPAEIASLSGEAGLTPEYADNMIENVVGTYALPLGIAQNFLINGRDVLVPMAIEEPSVVAAASFMARLARAGGGFEARSTNPDQLIVECLDNHLNYNRRDTFLLSLQTFHP